LPIARESGEDLTDIVLLGHSFGSTIASNRFADRLHCPEGYTLTALTALAIAKKALAGQFSAGFQIPSLAYGADLILEIEGVIREDLVASCAGYIRAEN
jgi:hypothetical protein